MTEGGTFTAEKAATYVDQILARINTELTTALAPPTAVDPRQVAEWLRRQAFLDKLKNTLTGGASYSVAMKDERSVKKGRERIQFLARAIAGAQDSGRRLRRDWPLPPGGA